VELASRAYPDGTGISRSASSGRYVSFTIAGTFDVSTAILFIVGFATRPAAPFTASNIGFA